MYDLLKLFRLKSTNGDRLRERTILLSALMYRNTTYPSLSTLLNALVGENGVVAAIRSTSSSHLLAPPPYTAAHHHTPSITSPSPSLFLFSSHSSLGLGLPFCPITSLMLSNDEVHHQVDVVPLDDVPHAIGNYDICVVKSVDINAATKHGIRVARIPSDATGNATSCAEMAIYQMLGLLRKQIFIMGYGNIGIHLAKRLRPFGVRLLATKRRWPSSSESSCKSDVSYSENGTHDDLVDEKGGHQDILKFASRADIVVCCLAMNSETAGIVDKDFISSMRKGALLINIARGGLLDYEAVLHHLKSGHLGGLGIDVAWTEPFDPDDAILKFSNVIITPHVAGVTECSYRFMAKVVGDVALQLHTGTPLTGWRLSIEQQDTG
ncbi:UNVERIFIED_CONTAM: D-3-phosphoglycerate dehydrogenase [Sesamum radiatum]|uniref:D-3-phosphoglycerate dehydrogenase n=1 Tax=Sesamum radiatum TaxID=300843 RepID=A0AAW2QDY5_SESRA